MAYFSSLSFGLSSSLVAIILAAGGSCRGWSRQFDRWHRLDGLVLLVLIPYGSRYRHIAMQFQVTEIEFDFDDPDEEFTQHHFDKVIDDTLGTIWEADDEDDLVEEITCATGWCIKSIDYRHVLAS